MGYILTVKSGTRESEKVPGGDQPKFPYRRAAPLSEKNPDLPDLRFENPKGKGWLRAGRLSFGGSTNSTLEIAIFKVSYNSLKAPGRWSFRLKVREGFGFVVLYLKILIQHAPKPPNPPSFCAQLSHDPYGFKSRLRSPLNR